MSDISIGAVGIRPVDTVRKQKTILGHPAGLFLLFFTEMWERFSYYGMRALLVLYMVNFLLPGAINGTIHVAGFGALRTGIEAMFGPMGIQPLSSQIYGLYTAFVYFTPFFGGMLADRVLGQRKTVVIGGVVMAIGQFLLMSPALFLPGLLCLILGNGCFKPNISTQVGSLYPPGDPRRDRAFTIFYMGVNLGAFFSPLICGTLGQVWGWQYGFGAAGVGMVAGLLLYLWGQPYLAKDQLSRAKETNREKVPFTSQEWKGIAGLVILCLLNIVFWGVYEQQGNTIQLFADRNADWHVFGFQMPSTWFQAFNPMFIFLFAPLLNVFWSWQSSRNREPGSVVKMGIGCVLLGLGFLPLMYVSSGLGADQKISFLWLAGATLIYTIGELYLSPIGLSLVTKVAPARVVSMMMGMWFMANFFGNYLTGYLGTFYEKMSRESFFAILGALAVGAGLAILALSKPLKNAVGHNN
ncbi:MAG TPA: peptide MFS transporter [Bryobacteraceae bacterium]|nr:peptide MFS transporter [Bryobacteraceae bacterium]